MAQLSTLHLAPDDTSYRSVQRQVKTSTISAEGVVPTLSLPDGCALAAAWLSALGEQHAIRLLVVKGQSLYHHGLRGPHTSADVDVLVEPASFDALCETIARSGWRRRPRTEVGSIWADHSSTYLSETWPCDIDVHRYFPGFLSSPEATFETLWRSRESMTIANRAVLIPNRPASILIAALHQLRDGESRTDPEQLRSLTSAELNESDRFELLQLAVETGAIDPARDFLIALGVDAGLIPRHAHSAAAHEWRSRVSANAHGAYFWILLLERTAPKDRIGVLWRAVWPRRATLLIDHPDARDTPLGRTSLRLNRLRRGLSGVVPALRTRLHVHRSRPARATSR